VLNFIDKSMAYKKGVTEPSYAQGPFAKAYEGEQPPPGAESQKDVVWVKKSELERYGSQGSQNPDEVYRKGLPQLQAYANKTYHNNFEKLPPEQQDQILKDMEDDKLSDMKEPSGTALFSRLINDTTNGFLSDPGYGGNKDMLGWKLIGYPGAQRAYPPDELHNEKMKRPPQDLAMLHNFHPGEMANPAVIVPLSGPNSAATPNPNP
jgi:gluconate 2-dehydrogenase gamma chain